MNRKLKIVLIALAIILVASPACAQGETPRVIHSTKPISAELTTQIDAWLADSPPSDALAYVVTYSKSIGASTQVSLAGVNVTTLPEEWSLFESGDTVVWIGTVTVDGSGNVTPLTETQAQHSARLAMPQMPSGGGSYVAFPFQAGKAMLYGPRAVHGSGDYGTSGMLAVDLVSGDDLGASAAPPYAYASDSGTIDYICDDGTTVAVRTHNATTDDYFLYAHLLDNASLYIGSAFAHGQQLGSIKYGSFSDSCGWAEQQSDHYHVHWMFEPAGGAFAVENCTLYVSTKKFKCGSETIGTGGWLRGGGGYGVGVDDFTGGQAVLERTFWDYALDAFLLVFHDLKRLLPEHTPIPFVYAIVGTLRMMLRVVWILHQSGTFNIFPLISVTLWSITLETVLFAVKSWGLLWRLVKLVLPG
jgi:hypothetical protein